MGLGRFPLDWRGLRRAHRRAAPFVRGGDPGGLGCNAQGAFHDKRPLVRDGSPGGWGCNAQTFHDKIPNVGPSPGGKGASQQRLDVQGAEPLDGSRLRPWMRALAERLRRVIVLRRDWTSAVTDTMTMRSERSMKVGVFLDPPYDTEHRNRALYGSDLDGTSAGVAAQCYAWAAKAAPGAAGNAHRPLLPKGRLPPAGGLAGGVAEILRRAEEGPEGSPSGLPHALPRMPDPGASRKRCSDHPVS